MKEFKLSEKKPKIEIGTFTPEQQIFFIGQCNTQKSELALMCPLLGEIKEGLSLILYEDEFDYDIKKVLRIDKLAGDDSK